MSGDDTITDFEIGSDVIDLLDLWGSTSTIKFSYNITTNADTVMHIDIDGDMYADINITLEGHVKLDLNTMITNGSIMIPDGMLFDNIIM